MKNTTKTIAVVLALFLVAALFVGAASAREVTLGKDAFVYEKITFPSSSSTWVLNKMSSDATPSVLNIIQADSNGAFDLLDASVGTYTGAYQVNDTSTTPATIKGTVNIWYPDLTLKAYLFVNFDSIDGKTINKDTPIKFYLESPKAGSAAASLWDDANVQKKFDPQAKILFTTPVGGKTTDLGDQGEYVFTDIHVNNSQVNTSTQVSNSANGVVIGNNAVAGTYAAQAEYYTGTYFSGQMADKYKKSNTVSFTVQSTTLTLTANKDSVVRSNPFTVTIQGESQKIYFVYLESISASDVNPSLQPGQSGAEAMNVTAGIPLKSAGGDPLFKYDVSYSNSYGYFKTDASGKRTAQYNTAADTEDKTYTVKVYDINKSTITTQADGKINGAVIDSSNYDSVKVKVEKGAVRVTAAGDRSYYIGEEIKLTGTNTDSSNVFLFITGPNLPADGIQLKDVSKQLKAKEATNPVSVKTDNTWEFKWNTQDCGLDTGAYTIYATSILTNGKSSQPDQSTGKAGILVTAANKNDLEQKYSLSLTVGNSVAVKLSDSEYATVSVNLKQPFLSAVPSGTTVAKGDKIYIRGTAEGDPDTLQLYVFGPNKFVRDSITVEDDGSYEKKLDIDSDWSSNQYYVVIEHPMYNNKIDVLYSDGSAGSEFGTSKKVLYIMNADDSNGVQSSFVVEGTGKLQGSNAADALTKMIDSPNIDDIYTKLTFTVQEAWIKINNPGDQAAGSTFTITGTTNLAVDDQILIEVVSSSFNAIDKTSTSTTSGFSQTTKVVAGESADNAWSIEVDSTNFKLDEYTIKAAGIETDVTTTTNFNIVEKVNPTVTPTVTVTGGQPTTTATTAVPTDAPKTPGFGAFIALAGLGAVALLVLRRN